jgi:predicted nucleic acid-binding Zn ribbon protein
MLGVWLVTALIAHPAASCISTFSSRVIDAHASGDPVALENSAAQAEQAHRAAPSLENTNDLAAARILAGRTQEGIDLLLDVEKTRPGSAFVAGNLGTALELLGRHEEALAWIRESVRRDPSLHRGTEWVHVKILEARLALQRDPDWLRRNSAIGWREGQRLPPNERSQPRTYREIVEAIGYQLERHTRFVAPPDAVLGDLYLTLGDIAHTSAAAFNGTWDRDSREAGGYAAALRYGTPFEARARERLAAAERRVDAARMAREEAARREQVSRARELANRRAADERRQRLEVEQRRRRVLPLIAFGTLALIVTAVVLWRRKRASR